MMDLKLSIPQRMVLVRVTLIFALILSVFLSAHLWGGYRSFPYAPFIQTDIIKPPFDVILTACLVLFLVASLFLKLQRIFIFLALILSICLVILDMNRLQPWFYVYNSLLTVFIFYNGRVDDSSKFTSIFIILQLIVASVYFYFGVSQLNDRFVNSALVELISPLRDLMSERQFLFFIKMGAISPYVLMFIGLGLIISPLRYIAISLAVCIHVLLLIFLFPSAKNTNYALWFSNLSFLTMLILLFSGKTKQRYFSPTFLFKMPLFYLVTCFFMVMPALNTLNRWPDYLSFNFKSGNTNSALILISQKQKIQLPLYLQHFCTEKNAIFYFNFDAWCNHELHVGCYPEEPVFRSIYGHLLDLTQGGVKDIQLEIVPKQKLLRKR